MFIPQLSSYRPSAIYADLLEWHRQVRLGSGQPVYTFTPEEFALLVARAELASSLTCANSFPAERSGRLGIERRVAKIVEGFRQRSRSKADAYAYYCRQFVGLARRARSGRSSVRCSTTPSPGVLGKPVPTLWESGKSRLTRTNWSPILRTSSGCWTSIGGSPSQTKPSLDTGVLKCLAPHARGRDPHGRAPRYCSYILVLPVHFDISQPYPRLGKGHHRSLCRGRTVPPSRSQEVNHVFSAASNNRSACRVALDRGCGSGQPAPHSPGHSMALARSASPAGTTSNRRPVPVGAGRHRTVQPLLLAERVSAAEGAAGQSLIFRRRKL